LCYACTVAPSVAYYTKLSTGKKFAQEWVFLPGLEFLFGKLNLNWKESMTSRVDPYSRSIEEGLFILHREILRSQPVVKWLVTSTNMPMAQN